MLARERHKQVVLATMAAKLDETSRKVATTEIPPKLVLDIPRERAVVRLTGVSKKLCAVLLH